MMARKATMRRRLPRIPSLPTDDSAAVADSAVSEPHCCEVCLVAPCEGFALVPCGHARFCERCANRVANMGSGCPVCRTDITMVMRVFAW